MALINEKNIKIVKLLNGDDLLCEAVKIDASQSYNLTNPFKVVVVPAPRGMAVPANAQPSIGLMPWMPFSADNIFNVKDEHILSVATPDKQFIDEYKRMFSAIVPVDKPPLILPGM